MVAEKLEKQRKYLESILHVRQCTHSLGVLSDKKEELWSSFDAGPMPLSHALLDERWVFLQR